MEIFKNNNKNGKVDPKRDICRLVVEVDGQRQATLIFDFKHHNTFHIFLHLF